MASVYNSNNQASLAEAKNLADSIVKSIKPLLTDPSRDEVINKAAGEISSAAELIKTSINSLTTTTNVLAKTLDKNGVSAVVKSIDEVASSFEKQVKAIVDSLTGLKSAQTEHYKASEEKIKETSLKTKEESDGLYKELYTLKRQIAEALSKGLVNEAKILEESAGKIEKLLEKDQRKGIGRRDFGGRNTDNSIRFEGFRGSYGKGTDDAPGIGDLIGNFKKAFTVENGLNKTRDFLVNKSSNPITGAIVGSIFNSITKKVRTRAAEKEQIKLDDQIFDERIKNEDTKAFLEEKYGNLDSAREAHRAQSADRRAAGKDIEKISKQKDEFLEKSRAVGYTDPEVEAHYEKLLRDANKKYSSIGAEDRRGGLTDEEDEVVSSGIVRTTISKASPGSLSSLEDANKKYSSIGAEDRRGGLTDEEDEVVSSGIVRTTVPTATNTNTPVPTATDTATPVPTATDTATPVPTATNTNTPVLTVTDTATPVPTATNTNTPVLTVTDTATPVPTATDTATPIPTATDTATPVPTATNTNTPVLTVTDTATPVPTATNTNTPVPTATDTATPVPTATDTATTISKASPGSLSSLEDARESIELNEASVGIQEKQLEVLQSILEALGGGKGPAGLKKGKKRGKKLGNSDEEDGEDGDEEGGRDWLDTLEDLSTILGGRGKRMPKGRRRRGRGKRMPKGRRRLPKAGKARGLKGLLSKGGGKLKLVGGLLGAGGLLGGAEAVLEDGMPSDGTKTVGKAGGAKAAEKSAEKAAEKGLAKSVGKAGGAKAAEKAAEKGLTKTVGKAGAKAFGKSALKKIPVIGALAGLGFAAGRAMDGDWLGAGGEVLSGIASIFPGIGTAASIAIDTGLAARDIAKDGETPGDLTLTESSVPLTTTALASGGDESSVRTESSVPLTTTALASGGDLTLTESSVRTESSVPLTTTALASGGNFTVNNSAGTAQVMNQLSEINSATDRAEKESIARISGAGAGAATASIINNTVSNNTVVQKPDLRNNEPTWMRQEALRYSPSNLGYVY